MKQTSSSGAFARSFGKKKTMEDIYLARKPTKTSSRTKIIDSPFKPLESGHRTLEGKVEDVAGSRSKIAKAAKVTMGSPAKGGGYVSVNKLVNGFKGTSNNRIGRDPSSESRENLVFVLSGKKTTAGRTFFNREDAAN